MKRILLTTFSCLLFVFFVQAQAPQAFQYQAVVRDAGGQVLAGQAVGLQISLIQDDGLDTATVYVETHDAVTNDFGLVNLQIGRGMPTSGDFSQIEWSNAMYVQIGLDVAGGSNYEVMGTSELLSVPYALHAANADSTDDADADPTNELQDWSTLPGIPADLLDGDQVEDADADATNELQTLSQNGSDVTLSNDGGTISVNDADADPMNELELPQDAEKGSVAYYDGESWKKVPAGGTGQVLTLGEDGIPYWGGLVNITLPNGDIVYFSPVDNFGGTGQDQVRWGPAEDITALPNLGKAEAEMDYNGASNTAAIIAQLGDYTPPNSNLNSYAAKLCDDLVAYGFDDWYLPAAGELLFAATQTELNFGNSVLYLSSTESPANDVWAYFEGSDGATTYPPAIYDGGSGLAAYKTGAGIDSNISIKCRCVRRN